MIATALMFASCAVSTLAIGAQADGTAAQITILYDAFGKESAMSKDWGYSAFIEYHGKRILFDTGNNPEILGRVGGASPK